MGVGGICIVELLQNTNDLDSHHFENSEQTRPERSPLPPFAKIRLNLSHLDIRSRSGNIVWLLPPFTRV